MRLRQVGAILMALLTACARAPHAVTHSPDPYEAELAAVRYELRVLTAGTVNAERVEVAPEDFHQALRGLASRVPPSGRPMETGRWLMEGGLEASLLAEVERGRVVRLTPLEDDSPLAAATAAEMRRKYLDLCLKEHGGGDCLGLLADGPTLQRDDLRTLALAIALGGVLKETRHALKETVSPQALMAMIVCTAGLYLGLWLLPEPASKALAASLTLALMAWLGVDTMWGLMDGWARLVWETDRATTFEQLQEAGRKYGQVLGENSAKVLVLLVTAALSGSAVHFAQRLPKLPGFQRAAVQAEAQTGVRLAAVADVETVAAHGEGTFTLMVLSPGGRGTAAAAEMAEARAGAATLIRHQGGNRQVAINGQRWHVPARRSLKDIPGDDPVGDQLQAAAARIAQRWSPRDLSNAERKSIEGFRAQGEHWKANLLEREARGRFVHRMVANEFKHLRWSHRGVDAIDPKTGYRYELLTRTDSNMARHGRRMAEELFRMISF